VIVGEDTIRATGATCTATSSESVCPRCGSGMHVMFTNGLDVAARFVCGCVRIDLTFAHFLRAHGPRTSELVLSACFAAWGERGAAIVPDLMKGGLQ
jgi:ribosomal protein S27AE